MVDEPRGFAQEGPGGRRAARTWNEEPRLAGKDGGNGLASESRAGRCLANSMHATGVEASAAGSAASTSGASWFTHATGKPRRRTPLPLNLWFSCVRPRRG